MLPDELPTEADLDAFLAVPSARLIEACRRLEGGLVVLGVAGKMGVTLALLARNALRAAGSSAPVIGVSRFSEPGPRRLLERGGVETIACDLIDPDAVARLPFAPNVIFMAGRKFGTQGDASATWAANVLAPASCARRYADSRMVAFSTGCVYPLVAPDGGGSKESDAPAPIGEYAQSCLGRERIFEHASRAQGTRVCLLRLNYAIDLRYGVLHDLGSKILRGEPIALGMSRFNCIWQGDANERALLALDLASAPARVLNLTGPGDHSVRETALALARELGKPARFEGEEGERSYLNDASESLELFGAPRVPFETMLRWTARWLSSGGRSLGKPTHFEVRNGSF